MTGDQIPVELSRLWRLPTSSRIGRPAELDVEPIVRTAVDLADREGLGGVTLSKVAQTLGFTKMSLYRHVGSKDELFELMADLAIGPGPEPHTDDGWRAGVRRWALADRAVYIEHPWLAHLPVSGPPRGPNAISWMDALLRVLRDTGLTWSTKLGIVNLVGGYVRQASLLEQQLRDGREGTGLDQAQSEREYGRTLARLVDPGRFPEAARLFAAEPFGAPPPDDSSGESPENDFTFGLELILDGIASAIGSSAQHATNTR